MTDVASDGAPPPPALLTGPDGAARCWWSGSDATYIDYHDAEWGVPEHDDVRLFEKLCLEGFQAGLAWITILHKRPAFRRAFEGFEPNVIATYGTAEIDRLLADESIVRHRGKIEATIANARSHQRIVEAFGSLDAYVWRFAPDHQPPAPRTSLDVPSATPASISLARDLRRRGWKFIGPTTAYAFMQAMGLVDDHLAGCFRRGAG